MNRFDSKCQLLFYSCQFLEYVIQPQHQPSLHKDLISQFSIVFGWVTLMSKAYDLIIIMNSEQCQLAKNEYEPRLPASHDFNLLFGK